VHQVQAVIWFKQCIESTLKDARWQQELRVHDMLNGVHDQWLTAATCGFALGWTPVSTVSRVVQNSPARGTAHQSAAQS